MIAKMIQRMISKQRDSDVESRYFERYTLEMGLNLQVCYLQVLFLADTLLKVFIIRDQHWSRILITFKSVPAKNSIKVGDLSLFRVYSLKFVLVTRRPA